MIKKIPVLIIRFKTQGMIILKEMTVFSAFQLPDDSWIKVKLPDRIKSI